MPELAELVMTAAVVNRYASHLYHACTRSAFAKMGPDLPIPRCWSTFRLQARSRGKELRIDLLPVTIDPVKRREEERERAAAVSAADPPSPHPTITPTPTKARRTKKQSEELKEEVEEEETKEGEVEGEGGQDGKKRKKPFVRVHPPNPVIPLDGPLPLLLRMGMSGHIVAYADPSRTHKHAHLTFHSSSPTPLAMCWVDMLRFGRWQVTADWDRTRSPCPYTEYPLFRRHVLDAVAKGRKTFDRPLCEVLLDQKYFNGIGNYLRAEICQRAGVNPFASARSVLEGLKEEEEEAIEVDGERADGDLLRLCHDVPAEVVEMGEMSGGRGKRSEMGEEEKEADKVVKKRRRGFRTWLRCYKQWPAGMVSTRDSHKRTMWHEPRWSIEGRTQEGPRKLRRPKGVQAAEEAKEEVEEAVDSAVDGAEHAEEDGDVSESETEPTPVKAKRGGGRKVAVLAAKERAPPAASLTAARARKRKEQVESEAPVMSKRVKGARKPSEAKRKVKGAATAVEKGSSAASEALDAVQEVEEISAALTRRRKIKRATRGGDAEAAAASPDIAASQTRRRSSRLKQPAH